MQLKRCQRKTTFRFPHNERLVIAARNGRSAIGRYLNACHLRQMPGQRVYLFAGVNVPHNEIAIFRTGNHLCFVGDGHGHTGHRITVADQHLSQFATGCLPHFQRHVTWAGYHEQWIDRNHKACYLVRMRHTILLVFTRQRPNFQAAIAIRANLNKYNYINTNRWMKWFRTVQRGRRKSICQHSKMSWNSLRFGPKRNECNIRCRLRARIS